MFEVCLCSEKILLCEFTFPFSDVDMFETIWIKTKEEVKTNYFVHEKFYNSNQMQLCCKSFLSYCGKKYGA